MRPLLLVLTLALPVGPRARAAQPSPDKAALIDQLMTEEGALEGAMASARDAFLAAVEPVVQANPGREEEVRRILTEEIDRTLADYRPDLRALLATNYDKVYDVQDLPEILAFARSPLGRKIRDKQKAINAESVRASVLIGRRMGDEIKRRFDERMRQAGLKSPA